MFKRVVFVTIFRKDYGGGEGRVAHELARQFAKHCETALISPGDHTELHREENGLKVLNIKSSGQGHICIPLLTQKNIRRIFDFLDEFGPDIVHIHDPALIGVLCQVWGIMRHVPVVHTTHVLPWKATDFGANEVVRIPDSFLTESITYDYLLNFYNNCDAIIALNPLVAEGMRNFGYEGRLFTIPNGRRLQTYSVCKNAAMIAQPKIISFIGFITRRKNQVYLLNVLKHLPKSYKLLLIGEALDKDYLEQLQEQVRQDGLENVEFCGAIKHDAIPGYLERTHVFVSASKMEVQSLVVIEALASGTPVVGLSNETVDELVDETVGFWLEKEAAPAEFAACVEAICNLSQAEYDRLCQNARARVKNLDWDAVIPMTINAYNALLRANNPTVPNDTARLARVISRIPSKTIQQTLFARVGATISRVKRVRRVSNQTWFFTAATVLGSLIIYQILHRPNLLKRSQNKPPDS